MTSIILSDMTRRQPVFAPEDGAGQVPNDPPSEATDQATDITPPEAQEAATGDDPAAEKKEQQPTPDAAASWLDGMNDDMRAFAKANGLEGKTDRDAAVEVLRMYQNAQKQIGSKRIAGRREGQSHADWVAENRAHLGVPETAEGYDIKIPEGFDETTWSSDLSDRALQVAVANGVAPEVHQAYVDAFAAFANDQIQDGTKAEAAMREQVTKEWGKEADARITAARQAAQRLAEQAGMDTEQLGLVGQALSDQIGASATIRLFDPLARAMADDTLAMGGNGDITLQDAKARLAALESPGGEYYEAVKVKNTMKAAEFEPELLRLRKIIAAASAPKR